MCLLAIGLMAGVHLIPQNSELNNYHPYASVSCGSYFALSFVNSFERIGVAAGKDVSLWKKGSLDLTLKVGVVTGYKKESEYKGTIYQSPRELFLTEGIMMSVAPLLKYTLSPQYSLGLTLLGDSLNAGVEYSF